MASTTALLEKGIADAAQTMGMRYMAFLDNPNDPETNHKFRVSIRTLRSLIAFLEPWQNQKQNLRIQKNLKRIVRETSRLREFDVLVALLRSLKRVPVDIVDRCATEATAERLRTLETLCEPEYVQLLQDALADCSSLRWNKQVQKKGLKKKSVFKRFDKTAAQLQLDLDGLDETAYETMHETRKRVKQARYISERYPELLGEKSQQMAKQMEAEQDRLGKLCDQKVNRELLESFGIFIELL